MSLRASPSQLARQSPHSTSLRSPQRQCFGNLFRIEVEHVFSGISLLSGASITALDLAEVGEITLGKANSGGSFRLACGVWGLGLHAFLFPAGVALSSPASGASLPAGASITALDLAEVPPRLNLGVILFYIEVGHERGRGRGKGWVGGRGREKGGERERARKRRRERESGRGRGGSGASLPAGASITALDLAEVSKIPFECREWNVSKQIWDLCRLK